VTAVSPGTSGQAGVVSSANRLWENQGGGEATGSGPCVEREDLAEILSLREEIARIEDAMSRVKLKLRRPPGSEGTGGAPSGTLAGSRGSGDVHEGPLLGGPLSDGVRDRISVGGGGVISADSSNTAVRESGVLGRPLAGSPQVSLPQNPHVSLPQNPGVSFPRNPQVSFSRNFSEPVVGGQTESFSRNSRNSFSRDPQSSGVDFSSVGSRREAGSGALSRGDEPECGRGRDSEGFPDRGVMRSGEARLGNHPMGNRFDVMRDRYRERVGPSALEGEGLRFGYPYHPPDSRRAMYDSRNSLSATENMPASNRINYVPLCKWDLTFSGSGALNANQIFRTS